MHICYDGHSFGLQMSQLGRTINGFLPLAAYIELSGTMETRPQEESFQTHSLIIVKEHKEKNKV